MSGYTVTDEFCGAGGSSSGLVRAGLTVLAAINHWDRAIETHAANHPDARHFHCDVSKLDKRNLPKTHILWGSPICTESSPGGGNKKDPAPPARGQLQLEVFGHVPQQGYERTRATFWDIIQATELHRYPVVIVENVVDVIWKWVLFDVWRAGMETLGYHSQIVSVSAAHIGDDANPYAPQWRDRIYILFTRLDLNPIHLAPSPPSWCFTCEKVVQGVQAWKNARRPKIGKYRRQYVYTCGECHTAVVEPLVLPAAAAIDWTDLGQRIGDRDELPVPATMRRIEVGYQLISKPYLMNVNHESGRYYPVDARPFSTRSTKIGDSLIVPGSYITTLRRNAKPSDTAGDPFPTFATTRNHWLTVPGAFLQKHHGGLDYAGVAHMVKDPLAEPMPAFVGKPNLSLVVPYRRGSKPHYASAQPISTLTTREKHSLLTGTPHDELMDLHFRMIKWREAANAQRFPGDYRFTGNNGENTMLAGNAVASNVAQWLGGWAIRTLDGAA